MILKGIMLSSIHRLKGERSTSATYYIIAGRKSIQTVQDIHMYGLKQFYSIYPKLIKSYFDKVIYELKKEQLIQITDGNEETYILSSIGLQWLEDHKLILPLSYYSGMQNGESSRVFWPRLKLLIQTITNVHKNEFHFIPVVEDKAIEAWVKLYYQRIKLDTSSFLQQLYEELLPVLQNLPNYMAEIFVDRLTSFKNYGKSVHQLASSHHLTTIDLELTLTAAMHRILDIIRSYKQTYSLLNDIIQTTEPRRLSNTAITTYQHLRGGFSIEEIAKRRKLRMNTIYDHVVEIALHDSAFPIDNYVSKCDQEIIIRAYNEVEVYKLKLIKQKVPEHITYFQIRLVLTMVTNTQKVGD